MESDKDERAFEASLLTCAYLLKACTIHYMYATVTFDHGAMTKFCFVNLQVKILIEGCHYPSIRIIFYIACFC